MSVSQDTSAAHDVDTYVGQRVRDRRKQLGVSQTQLAQAIGLTFQQVQKYERGGNRISASKLFDIGRTLKVPPDYFFHGFDADADSNAGLFSDTELNVNAFLKTEEGQELSRSFPRIQDGRQRRKLVELVQVLANPSPET